MFIQADALTESDTLVHNHYFSIFEQTVDFFAASSYGAATVASGDVSVNMAAAKIDVSGRHVLVVSSQRSARHRWGGARLSCQRHMCTGFLHKGWQCCLSDKQHTGSCARTQNPKFCTLV